MSETQVEEPVAEVDAPDGDTPDAPDEDTESKAGTSGRIQLPDGIVSPITALNHLKRKRLAPADHPPQRMYGYVKNPGKEDPFPVKHYDADGKTFDEPQVDDRGHTITRPGVKISQVVDWWGRAGVRQKAREEKKAEAAKVKAAKEEEKARKAAAAGLTDEEGSTESGQVEAGAEEYVDAGAEAE